MRPGALLMAAMAALLLIASACGGGSADEDEASASPTATATGAIPTATPFAVTPEPTIVSEASASPTPPTEVTYVVEPGDSLSRIAERFDTTVQAIMDRNGLTDPTLIFIDQKLSIPAASSPGEATATPSPGTGDTETYVVKAGDTAYEIAQRFNVTLVELAAANGTTVDALNALNIGDELTLPRPR